MVQDIWARILEDKEFLKRFLSENRRRLAARYAMVASFLRENDIPFFQGGNAGVFVWIDLRHLLRDPKDLDDAGAMLISSPKSGKYHSKEELLGSTGY
jgi:DNA-binding transcriptional MocR family regulator